VNEVNKEQEDEKFMPRRGKSSEIIMTTQNQVITKIAIFQKKEVYKASKRYFSFPLLILSSGKI